MFLAFNQCPFLSRLLSGGIFFVAASIEDSSIKGHFPFFVSLGERASRLNPSSLRPSGDLTAEPAKGSQHHQTVGLTHCVPYLDLRYLWGGLAVQEER